MRKIGDGVRKVKIKEWKVYIAEKIKGKDRRKNFLYDSVTVKAATGGKYGTKRSRV